MQVGQRATKVDGVVRDARDLLVTTLLGVTGVDKVLLEELEDQVRIPAQSRVDLSAHGVVVASLAGSLSNHDRQEALGQVAEQVRVEAEHELSVRGHEVSASTFTYICNTLRIRGLSMSNEATLSRT